MSDGDDGRVFTKTGHYSHGYPWDLRFEGSVSPVKVFNSEGVLIRIEPAPLEDDDDDLGKYLEKYIKGGLKGGKISKRRPTLARRR